MTVRQVLGVRVMRRVWYAQVVSLFGDFLALYAVISVVSFRMHGTPTEVTWVQISYMLPLAALGPLAGVFIDRWPLKATLIASDLSRAVFALLLMVSVSVWHVYLVLIAISSVSSFFMPAQSVTIRSHVPREGLLAANSLMQMAMMGVRILGPATAGALVGAFGPNLCYGLDVLSFAASAALIASVAIRRSHGPDAAPTSRPRSDSATDGRIRALWRDMTEGLRFIMRHPAVQFVVIAMGASLFTVGCFGPLIAIYVRESLHASAGVFGVVSAAIGVGMLVGTQSIRAFARHARNDTMVLWGLAGVGAGAFLLGIAVHTTAAFAATFVIGLAFSAIIVPAQTLLQQETPHAMMGRVSSSVTSVVFFAQLLGLVLSGVLAELLGIRLVFLLCGALAGTLAAGGRMFLVKGRPV